MEKAKFTSVLCRHECSYTHNPEICIESCGLWTVRRSNVSSLSVSISSIHLHRVLQIIIATTPTCWAHGRPSSNNMTQKNTENRHAITKYYFCLLLYCVHALLCMCSLWCAWNISIHNDSNRHWFYCDRYKKCIAYVTYTLDPMGIVKLLLLCRKKCSRTESYQH